MDNASTNTFDLPMRGRPPAPRSPPHRTSNPAEVGMNGVATANGYTNNHTNTAASTNSRLSTPAQPLAESGAQTVNDRLIVGVDFGTTYSGYEFEDATV